MGSGASGRVDGCGDKVSVGLDHPERSAFSVSEDAFWAELFFFLFAFILPSVEDTLFRCVNFAFRTARASFNAYVKSLVAWRNSSRKQ